MNDKELIETYFASFIDNVLCEMPPSFWWSTLFDADDGAGYMQDGLLAQFKVWRKRVEVHDDILDDAACEYLAKRQKVMEEEASRLAQVAADYRSRQMSEAAADAYAAAELGNWWRQQDDDDIWYDYHMGKD